MANPKRRGRRTVIGRKAKTMHHSTDSAIVVYGSLDEIEDRNDMAFWNTVTRDAAVKAINENKAMDIPITVLEDGWVVRKLSDGTIEKVAKVETTTANKPDSLTKGSILHVKTN